MSVAAFSQQADSVARKKPKFVFSFDARYSFIQDRNARIGGLKMGLDLNRKYRFGLGFYDMTSPFYKTIRVENTKGGTDTVEARIRFGYFSPYGEYVIFQNRKWEFSIPLQLGGGDTRLEYQTDGDSIRVMDKRSVVLLEISATGHYKFFPWVGVGAGVGYRKMLVPDRVIREAFDSPIYIVKLKLFVGYIYRKVFPKKEKD